MAAEATPPITRPAISAALLMERGAAVPFTTPILAGARIRPVKGGVEVVVANPSGGRGAYVFDLRALPDFCSLTVHDRLLLDGLLAAGGVSPAVVRRVARQIARSGAAGREAARASTAALSEEDGIIQLTNVLLIVKLLQQAGIEIELARLDVASPDLRQRLRAQLGAFAPALGMTGSELLAAVEEISVLAAPAGFSSREFTGRHERSLIELRQLQESLLRWSAIEAGDLREVCDTVLAWSRSTLTHADPIVAESQQMFDDLRRLLLIWSKNPVLLRERFEMVDWLLDGCAEICMLWRSVAAEPRAIQAATMYQISRMIPGNTLEERGALRLGQTVEESAQQSRWVKLNEDWRTGVVVIEAQARQEALRGQVA